jgi:aspartyl-tRNA synthetase
MELYGSDKPDLRIDLECRDVTGLVKDIDFAPFKDGEVKAVAVSGCTLTRKQIDQICADTEVQSGVKPYWFRMDENGELVGGVAKFMNEKKDEVVKALGLAAQYARGRFRRQAHPGAEDHRRHAQQAGRRRARPYG